MSGHPRPGARAAGGLTRRPPPLLYAAAGVARNEAPPCHEENCHG